MRQFAIAMLLLTLASTGRADEVAEDDALRFYYDLAPNSVEELTEILGALDDEETINTDEPIVIMLHGQEAESFMQRTYSDNKTLVDQAAKLDAFGLIDVRICKAWLTQKRIQQSEIPAFVDVVPFARKEIKQLKNAGFQPINKIDL